MKLDFSWLEHADFEKWGDALGKQYNNVLAQMNTLQHDSVDDPLMFWVGGHKEVVCAVCCPYDESDPPELIIKGEEHVHLQHMFHFVKKSFVDELPDADEIDPEPAIQLSSPSAG